MSWKVSYQMKKIYKMFPIDSTIIKVHQDAGYKKELIGKSRGGNTTKIHTLVDAIGYLVRIEIISGQISDHIFAPKLIKDLKLKILMAYSVYDSISLHS